MRKTLIYLGLGVGSIIGGFIPSLLGQDMFSMWSIFWSAVGGILGVYLTYKWTEGMD